MDPTLIDKGYILLAQNTAKILNSKSCAIYGIHNNGENVLVEISYTYVGWMIHSWPGHWLFESDCSSPNLKWVGGQMKPEKAQVEVFLNELERRYGQ